MIDQSQSEGSAPVAPRQSPIEVHMMHSGLAALHEASEGSAADAAGARFVQDGGMVLSIAAKLPASAIVLNHGFVDPDPATFARAAEAYRNAQVARFFLSTMQAVAPEALQASGMAPARGWRMFRRSLSTPAPDPSDSVEVSRLQRGQGADFARIVSDAFDLGDASRPMLESLPAAAGWHVFQGELNGTPAGTGALFVSGENAWTDFGSTSPAHRGKGVQKSLLAHRIRFARSLGCRTICTCTGEEVPGDAQISYHNILRAGFEEADLMLNYAPA